MSRKSVKFDESVTASFFFINQTTNLVLEKFQIPIQDSDQPAYCPVYQTDVLTPPLSPETFIPELMNYTNMSEISSVNCHFFLFIDQPGEFVSEIASKLLAFFAAEKVESFHIVRPVKHTDSSEDFTIGFYGIIIGVTFKETEQAREFIISDTSLAVPGLCLVRVIPGPRGEHFWSIYQRNRSCLQGFFFLGEDPVDVNPSSLCYIVSIPKGVRLDFILNEIYSHIKQHPLHVISNPFEGKVIIRAEYEKAETIRMLIRLGVKIDGKSIIVIPCNDRTPVELLYQPYQVIVNGYSNAIHPKEFIRILTDNFGHVAEFNINFSGYDSLIVFQSVAAAEKCLAKKELFVKNSKLKFASASRPFRLTGQIIHKGCYNTLTPRRPLPEIPAPYIYQRRNK